MYYIPKKDQLKFYLLSNLMLQHGVTDEIAIPLILSGLGPENEWVKLEKSHLGGLKGRNGKPVASSRYPLFNRAAALLYPMDLNAVTTDPKLQKIFCLNNRCVYRFGLYPKQITHSVVLDIPYHDNFSFNVYKYK